MFEPVKWKLNSFKPIQTFQIQMFAKVCVTTFAKHCSNLTDPLTVGLTNTDPSLCGGGIVSLMPSFGGNDCDRRCPYRCGGSICLAGDRGYFRSCSGKYVVIVIKPAFPEFDCNGIRSRAVS